MQFGWKAVDRNGKINDDIFMSITGAAEFGTLSNDIRTYFEAIEAMSNQYYSDSGNPGPMQCYGSCNIADQLLWATQMEAWYGSNLTTEYVVNAAWQAHEKIGFLALRGFAFGADTSWFWGNVDEADFVRFEITATGKSYYPGLSHFIVYSRKY